MEAMVEVACADEDGIGCVRMPLPFVVARYTINGLDVYSIFDSGDRWGGKSQSIRKHEGKDCRCQEFGLRFWGSGTCRHWKTPRSFWLFYQSSSSKFIKNKGYGVNICCSIVVHTSNYTKSVTTRTSTEFEYL